MRELFDKNIFKSTIHILYSVIFAIFVALMVFHFAPLVKTFTPNSPLIFALAAVSVLIGTLILKLLKKATGKKGTAVRGGLLLACFCVQFYLFWKTSYTPGWDANIVVRTAIDGFLDMLYYSKIPNNLMPAIVMRAWVNVTDFLFFISPLKRLIILNILCINGALFFMYLSVKRVFGRFAADRAMLIALPLIAFSPWIATPYTDTLSIAFPIFALYSFIRAAQSTKTWQKQLFLALTGAAVLFGAYIKATVLIMGIAIILALVTSKRLRQMFNFKLDIRRNSIVALLCGLAISFALATAVQYPFNARIQAEHPDEVQRTLLYYLELGVNTYGYGGWNPDTYAWTNENIKAENYEEMAMERIKNIVEGYGVQGMAGHMFNKLLWAGTDGVFAYGMEGAFYPDPQDPQDTTRGYLQNYVYHTSDFFQNYLSQFLQAIWILVCLQSALSVLFLSKDEFSFVAKIAVGGLFLYLMIFENRSRYVFLYTPVIIFAAQCTADNLLKACTQFATSMFKKKKKEAKELVGAGSKQ